MMKLFSRISLLSATTLLLAALPARGDSFTFSLSTVNPTVTPGSTTTFNGLISAPLSNGGSISLLGDNFTVASPLTLDDTDFYLDTPATLSPGGSYNGPLFTVMLALGSAGGIYTGSYLINVSDANGNPLSQTALFQVTAPAATAVTPEPRTWLLLLTGLAGAALIRRRQTRALS